MTRAIPFSKANIKRRIEAAREAGLDPTGITADGTLLVRTPGTAQPTDKAPSSKWDDQLA